MKRLRMKSSVNSFRSYNRDQPAKTRMRWFKRFADWVQMTILRTILTVTSSWHLTASYHQHFNSLPLLLRQPPTCLTRKLSFHIPRMMAAMVNKRNRHTLSCSAERNVMNIFSMTRFFQNFPRTLTIKLLHSHCATYWYKLFFFLLLELRLLPKSKDNE